MVMVAPCQANPSFLGGTWVPLGLSREVARSLSVLQPPIPFWIFTSPRGLQGVGEMRTVFSLRLSPVLLPDVSPAPFFLVQLKARGASFPLPLHGDFVTLSFQGSRRETGLARAVNAGEGPCHPGSGLRPSPATAVERWGA